MSHLEARLAQSGRWSDPKTLTHQDLVKLLYEKIELIDFEAAKSDVIDFLKDKSALKLWSQAFFKEITKKLTSVRNNVP